jgi:hypothetical protein
VPLLKNLEIASKFKGMEIINIEAGRKTSLELLKAS